MPIKPPARKADKGMIAAAASADEAASKKQAGGASGNTATPDAAAIVIDASTPEGIVKAYVEIKAAVGLTQWPDLLIADQEKIARPIADGLAPLVDPFRQLLAGWAEKFPNDPFPVNQVGPLILVVATKYKAGPINKASDQEASVDLEIENAAQAKTVTLKLKQIDGAWKIEDPLVPPGDKAEELAKLTPLIPKFGEAIQNLASKITKGELATAKDAGDEYAKAWTGFIMQAMQAANGGTPKPDAAPADKPADGADATKPQGDNKPDPLDGTYTGPNQLRRGR